MGPERFVDFAERLAAIAVSGGGVEAMASHLADATGTAVLLEDPQRRRIASAGLEPLPPDARPPSGNGAAAGALRLTAGKTHVGWLRVIAGGEPASRAVQPQDVTFLARLAAAAIAVELARQPGPVQGRELFWERVIDRVHSDADAIRDDAVACGVVPASAYLAIALECEGGADAAGLRAIAGDVFGNANGGVGLLERTPALLVFVPAAREIDASNARTAAALLPKTVAKRRREMTFSGGVGTVEPPLTLYRSAEAARSALAIGRRVFGSGCVVSYDALGAYPLLYEGADLRRFQTFARGVLAPLREYDERHQTELERTLRLFFETGQNVKTAAARLNVHRHTVFYRLRQIADICACALESPHDQLTLRLAVAIDALHSS